MQPPLFSNIAEHERFEALFQYASVGILIAGDNGKIKMANNFCVSLFGYSNVAELIDKKVEELIPARFHKNHINHREKFIRQPERRPMGVGIDLHGLRKDKSEFPVEISLSHYKADGRTYVFAFISDITRRKEIEKAVLLQKEELAMINKKIEKLNDDLEQKVELRTKQLTETLLQLEKSKEELTTALSKEKELSDLKSRFVSMASHEFRTPLSTILSSASLVAKYTQTDEQEKREKHISRIKSSVANLTGLLNEFLSIGKIEDGKIIAHYSSFNIYELVTAICGDMNQIIKPNQELVYTHTGSELVTLDPSLLRNIIINLISNAAKFTDEKGSIKIKSAFINNTITISVKDNGIGISEEDQKHLFERFFRGANVANIQGTGLGLHIVYKYAELMNGNIEFYSKLEEGTEFIVTFINNGQ